MPDSQPFIPSFDFYEHVLARWDPTSVDGWNYSPCHDTALTILMGTLVAVACGWIGCYLVLHGMGFGGDALSPTVPQGNVGAFSFAGPARGPGGVLGSAGPRA